jgi:hypothetical protein
VSDIRITQSGFGLILPSRAFSAAFGEVSGYFLLRWFLTAALVLVIFGLLSRRGRPVIGVLVSFMVVLNPIYIRAMMTMYSTVVGVPLIGISAAILLMVPTSRRVSLTSKVGVGLLLGIAIHANPFCAMPIGAMVSVWALLRYLDDRRRAIEGCVAIFFGLVVTSAVGALVYLARFGSADIFSPSLRAARELKTASVIGSETSFGWLNFRPEVWLVPAASLIGAAALRSCRRKVEWYESAALAMPAAMWAAFALNEFMSASSTLSLYFYTSYLIGPCLVGIGNSILLLTERWPTKLSRTWVAVLMIPLLLPFGWTHLFHELSVWMVPGAVVLLGGLVVATFGAGRYPWLTYIAVIGLLTAPFILPIGTPRDVPLSEGQPFRQDPRYFQVFNNYDDSKFDVFRLGVDFATSVPDATPGNGEVVFWHRDTDDVATLVQWTYLGPFTSLQGSRASTWPLLDDADLVELQEHTPQFVVVVSSDASERDAAEQALAQTGLSVAAPVRLEFERGMFAIYLSIVEFAAPAPGCPRPSLSETPVYWSDRVACPAS